MNKKSKPTNLKITVTDNDGNMYSGILYSNNTIKTNQDIKKTMKGNTKPPTPTSALHELYEEQYFKEKRKFSDISEKLQLKGYNFTRGHISQALERAKYLITEGKKHNYTFIQKYPPS